MAVNARIKEQFKRGATQLFDAAIALGEEGYIREAEYHPIKGLSSLGTVEPVRVFIDQEKRERNPDTDVEVHTADCYLLQHELSVEPQVGAQIVGNGRRWTIQDVIPDPAYVSWLLKLER